MTYPGVNLNRVGSGGPTSGGKSLLPDSEQTIAYNQTGWECCGHPVRRTAHRPFRRAYQFCRRHCRGSRNLQRQRSVGQCSGGPAATFILGDTTKTSASVSITNTYTQLATGVMAAKIGGTNAGSQYSQLNVTGAVNLSGTLNIKLINKFKPQVGQVFTILKCTVGNYRHLHNRERAFNQFQRALHHHV